jgi:hypothetical protein
MKFILTRELGRLSKWLRILGFDTEYVRENKLSSLIILALRDERIILTRNGRMPDLPGAKVVYIKSERIKEQLLQLLKELNLKPDSELMFSRCTICNLALEQIEKQSVMNKVPEYVFNTQDFFLACPDCKRIYWQGTHWGNVQKVLEEIDR